jgi:hypothetical protein
MGFLQKEKKYKFSSLFSLTLFCPPVFSKMALADVGTLILDFSNSRTISQ